MLKRDFIIVQIQELGKVIAQLINNRLTGATRKNASLVQVVYTSLKITPDQLMNTAYHDLRYLLDQQDNAGLQRMEIAAKTLLEEGYLHPEKQREYRRKAKEILEYIQDHDTTYSLERTQLIQELTDD